MTALLSTVLSALDRHDCRTLDLLESGIGIDRRSIVRATGDLISRGFAERAELGCYRMTAAGEEWVKSGKLFTPGPNGPLTQSYRTAVKETLFDGLWRAIRVQQTPFSINTLLTLSHNEEVTRVVRNRCARYLAMLTKRYILREMPRREPGTALTSNGFKRWSLMVDLGPLTPQPRKQWTELYDPNTQEIVGVLE